MQTKKRRVAGRVKPTRAMVLAAGRNVVAAIAQWTTLIFDAGAAKRLTVKGLPANINLFNLDVKDFDAPGIVGSQIETSSTIINLARAYDFAESGRWSGTAEQLDALIHDLTPLGAFLVSARVCDQMETEMIDPAATAFIMDTIRGAEARWALYSGRSVDLPQMARLAGLTEKTVRMAAIRRKKGEQNLPTYKDGPRTLVKASEAMRWLGKRSAFKATHISDLAESELIEPRTPLQLGALLLALRLKAGLTPEEIKKQLGLKGKLAGSYDDLEGGWWDATSIDVAFFDVAGITKLAEILGVKKRMAFVQGVAEFMAPYRIERQLAMQYGITKK